MTDPAEPGDSQDARVGDAPVCPLCGSENTTEIIYGLVFNWSDDDVLGGCVSHDDSPSHACRDCGARFGRLGPRWWYDEG